MPPATLSITPAQCREHGLPPVGIEFPFKGALMPVAFPAPGVYARFCGPPGGALTGEFSALRPEEFGWTLEQIVRARFDTPPAQPFALGAQARCELGPMLDCIVFVVGHSHARTSCFASVVDASPAKILVVFGLFCYAGVPEYQKIVSHPNIAEVIASLKISQE
jgi:hypothetical protein